MSATQQMGVFQQPDSLRLFMKDSLKPGLTFALQYTVPENKTVPYLFPEAPEFQVMPNVLATGFMVGLFEWACIKMLTAHLDWPDEQSVGTGFTLNHLAATPPGLTINVQVTLENVEGKKLVFSITADDGVDKISEATHERFVINAEGFNKKVAKKREEVFEKFSNFGLPPNR
jgi:fluoroacetyl-CoA thioesterase